MINWNKTLVSADVINYSFKKQNGQSDFTFRDFMCISKHDPDAREFVKAIHWALEDSRWAFGAYFWECPPVSWDSADRQFEFVTVQAPSLLKIQQNNRSFADKFHRGREEYVTSFLNLGGDAVLVAPVPESGKDFSHLAKFNSEVDNFIKTRKFWEKVAEELEKALHKDHKLKWLSTNGLGVHYLHVRIDDNPKYYQYQPYKAKSETRYEMQIKPVLGLSEDLISRDSKHLLKELENTRDSALVSSHYEYLRGTLDKPAQSDFPRNEPGKAQTTYGQDYSGHGKGQTTYGQDYSGHGRSPLPDSHEPKIGQTTYEQYYSTHGRSPLTGSPFLRNENALKETNMDVDKT